MTKAAKQSISERKNAKTIKISNNIDTSGDNAPDYKNNLYFEPKITWNDFMNYCNNKVSNNKIDSDIFGEYVKIGFIKFYKSGTIRLENLVGSIAKNRTYEQYKEIISNLYL